MSKLCKGCGRIKPDEEFYKRNGTRDGLQPRCKPCSPFRPQKRTSEQLFKDNLWQKYRIRLEDFNSLVEKQGGLCAICKTKPVQRLVVDHCHSTGKVRGLLCKPCNTGIGMFKDSSVFLLSAIQYLADE